MRVEAKQTIVSIHDYARAVIKAWKMKHTTLPSKASVAVLYAQYIIETGGKACFNWNIGNVKHVDNDGFDYHELVGTWECLAHDSAAKLIGMGLAKPDTNPAHTKACPAGKTAVIFLPPHPATWFRAYPNLDEAMSSHLTLIEKRYERAWADVLKGDPLSFAHTLKAGRDGIEGTWDDYFTASAEAYAAGMAPAFKQFMASDAFDVEMTASLEAMAAPTVPAIEDPPSSKTTNTRMATLEDFGIIHPPLPRPCPNCIGQGTIDGDTCPTCKGACYVEADANG